MRRLKLNNFTEQRYPREIRCSPDGRRYAFSLRSISDDRASYCHDLYVGKIDGPPPVKLTDDGRQAMVFWDDNDHLITCSPMDTRPDSPWVFSRINVSTGQSEPFVCLSVMPIRMWHLPGGKYLLWGQSMGTHLFGQTRADGVDDEKRRLFIFDKASGQAHPLTDVDQNVVHVDVRDNKVLFTAQAIDADMEHGADVYVHDIQSKTQRHLTACEAGRYCFAEFYDERILCRQTKQTGQSGLTEDQFFLVDGQSLENLGRFEHLSASVSSGQHQMHAQQLVAGDSLYFISQDGAAAHLCTFVPGDGVECPVGQGVSVLDFDVRGDTIVYAAFEGIKLPEIYVCRHGQISQLSCLNTAQGAG